MDKGLVAEKKLYLNLDTASLNKILTVALESILYEAGVSNRELINLELKAVLNPRNKENIYSVLRMEDTLRGISVGAGKDELEAFIKTMFEKCNVNPEPEKLYFYNKLIEFLSDENSSVLGKLFLYLEEDRIIPKNRKEIFDKKLEEHLSEGVSDSSAESNWFNGDPKKDTNPPIANPLDSAGSKLNSWTSRKLDSSFIDDEESDALMDKDTIKIEQEGENHQFKADPESDLKWINFLKSVFSKDLSPEEIGNLFVETQDAVLLRKTGEGIDVQFTKPGRVSGILCSDALKETESGKIYAELTAEAGKKISGLNLDSESDNANILLAWFKGSLQSLKGEADIPSLIMDRFWDRIIQEPNVIVDESIYESDLPPPKDETEKDTIKTPVIAEDAEERESEEVSSEREKDTVETQTITDDSEKQEEQEIPEEIADLVKAVEITYSEKENLNAVKRDIIATYEKFGIGRIPGYMDDLFASDEYQNSVYEELTDYAVHSGLKLTDKPVLEKLYDAWIEWTLNAEGCRKSGLETFAENRFRPRTAEELPEIESKETDKKDALPENVIKILQAFDKTYENDGGVSKERLKAIKAEITSYFRNFRAMNRSVNVRFIDDVLSKSDISNVDYIELRAKALEKGMKEYDEKHVESFILIWTDLVLENITKENVINNFDELFKTEDKDADTRADASQLIVSDEAELSNEGQVYVTPSEKSNGRSNGKSNGKKTSGIFDSVRRWVSPQNGWEQVLEKAFPEGLIQKENRKTLFDTRKYINGYKNGNYLFSGNESSVRQSILCCEESQGDNLLKNLTEIAIKRVKGFQIHMNPGDLSKLLNVWADCVLNNLEAEHENIGEIYPLFEKRFGTRFKKPEVAEKPEPVKVKAEKTAKPKPKKQKPPRKPVFPIKIIMTPVKLWTASGLFVLTTALSGIAGYFAAESKKRVEIESLKPLSSKKLIPENVTIDYKQIVLNYFEKLNLSGAEKSSGWKLEKTAKTAKRLGYYEGDFNPENEEHIKKLCDSLKEFDKKLLSLDESALITLYKLNISKHKNAAVVQILYNKLVESGKMEGEKIQIDAGPGTNTNKAKNKINKHLKQPNSASYMKLDRNRLKNFPEVWKPKKSYAKGQKNRQFKKQKILA
ncbi:hypothetical protein JXB01_01725 [Candidatus Micrarchaeota archaeon]|nr:hypothetical protein [Candidatus Micrarchaeota archaeon]